jgi:hypothetical protein
MAARFMGLAAITGPLLIAGIACAAPAQADATAYLNHLHNVGIHDVEGGDAALLRVGQKLCNQMSYGVPPADLVGMALRRSDAVLGANGLTPDQADALVGYALADLCPDA